METKHPTTLVDLLKIRAQTQPHQLAYTFLVDGEIEAAQLTYSQLDQQASAIAAQLQSSAAAGERALLLYPAGLAYLAAFFGCLYAGIVAVPTYPPRRNRADSRLPTIATDAQATVVLTTTEVLAQLPNRLTHAAEFQNLPWLATDDQSTELAEAWQPPDIRPNTLAFLQYTSGSTSSPKGVMVNHANLLHNLEDLDRGFQHTSQSVMVTWLPIFHDMGLIYGILQPLYKGFPCYLMPPAAFLQRPLRWLQAISRYHGTHSAAPNFAYELCAQRITPAQRASLDLQHWRMALNAAEPVREETLKRFATTFESCGFAWESFSPGYGLAETTLKVTAVRQQNPLTLCWVDAEALAQHRVVEAPAGQLGAQALVGCGQSEVDTQVVIVDPTTLTTCPPDKVGEIWVLGHTNAQGYWQRSEQTQQTFQAHLADTGVGPFLRTGDLGFLKDGELFVTGRLKDMIIIRGLNHYPQDLELTAQKSHPALRLDCGAAFAVDLAGEEQLVIVQELERHYLRKLDLNEIVGAVRQNLAEQHDVQLYALLLIKTGQLPKTSSGKIQRQQCRTDFLAGNLSIIAQWQPQVVESLEPSVQPHLPTADSLQAWLLQWASQRFKMPATEIDTNTPLTCYGMDSATAVSLSGELGIWLERTLPPTLAYDYPTLADLVQFLTQPLSKTPNLRALKTDTEAIAIIGMGCRFPSADDIDSFWQLLQAGRDAITPVPPSRWPTNTVDGTHWGGFLTQVEEFEPTFFGISPREAPSIDPQQRLLLEVSWETLEQAGYSPEQLAGSQTGVFIGISSDDFARWQCEHRLTFDAYSGTGIALSIAANRISYALDLRGPSLAIDTACSSSLVAVHQAGQSLQRGECDLALAGGVNLMLTPALTLSFAQAGMLAADGRCKTFDASADGYVRGEGCGIVLLKRFEQAVKDGDTIFALIKGSAVNQDGRSNGITAPNGPAQQAVIRQALANAQLTPDQISYVEAHGTGTALGDPIEFNALADILQSGRSPQQPAWIGSVKTNIGHLEAAAGIAGLIKVVLALQHQQIPPHLHLQTLNPHLAIANTSLAIPTTLQPWDDTETRFAGVSSFGFGGTNAHVILASAPQPIAAESVQWQRPQQILTWSAKSEPALRALAKRYVDYLHTHPDTALADLSFTTNTGRAHFPHRLATVATSTTQLAEQLQGFIDDKAVAGLKSGRLKQRSAPKLAFLFTGQGAQYVSMGQQLYATQPVFRQTLEQCTEILRPYLEKPLLEVLYPATAETHSLLNETRYTQPALFALEYALAQLWQSWGITPAVVMGHSVGEYVAAGVAKVFSLEDGLKLIAERARLMQALPPGGEMVAVFADETRVTAALAPYTHATAIAAWNEPTNIVISGETSAIRAVVTNLESQGIETRPLQVSHAFHSPLMAPILDDLEKFASHLSYQQPKMPLISNVSGQLLTQTPNAAYWREHTRSAVKFQQGITTLLEQGYEHFVEIGPKPVLTNLGRSCQTNTTATWLASLQPKATDWSVILSSLATLYLHGSPIDWVGFHHHYSHHRLPSLPTYPFQRQRYWFEDQAMLQQTPSPTTTEPAPAVVTTTARKDTILSTLCTLTAELLQLSPAEVDAEQPLLEMGADSLVIGQVVRKIENQFGVTFTLRQIFEELNTLEALATYIAQQGGVEEVIPLPIQSPSSASELEKLPMEPQSLAVGIQQLQENPLEDHSIKPVSDTTVERIMQQQLQIMSQQLQVLRGIGKGNGELSKKGNGELPKTMAQPVLAKAVGDHQLPKSSSPLPPWRVTETRAKGLTPQQQRHLETLTNRYTKRTAKSKQLTQQYRSVLADSRASAGFRLSTKEMLYPIVGERAQGSRTWDVDGNEYLDITMGFGVNLFGHHPPFVVEALQQQLQKSMQLGLQTPLAGQVAQLIRELTGMERVTFCNSGTEAVMTALRLARTATGRRRVVQFDMSYHGHFDGTLGEVTSNNNFQAIPASPGVSPQMVADLWMLDYGNPQSLKTITAHAHELAAVLVEPVQSRRPDLQPRAFLQELRQITQQANIPLIFDEMITGFRIHQGGAQAWFGVQADITTYGKIVGGGMPIGVVAGKAGYLNGIDGGWWNYGDTSYPQADTTFFAGTFCKHPLAMATALAVLQEIQKQGPSLQEQLNQRTAQLANTLNNYFEAEAVPIRIAQFGSLFRFTYSGNRDLLYYHLLDKGIYVWEGRNCFLSTAHTDEDIEYIIKAVKDSVDELRQGGFLPSKGPTTSPSPQQAKQKLTPPTIEQQAKSSVAKLSLAKQPLPDYLLTPIEIKNRLTLQMEQWRSQLGVEDYSEIISQLERLSVAYVLNAFQQMGWQFDAGKRFSTAWLANQLSVIGPYHRLLNRLLEMLAEEGWLHLADEQWEVVQTPPPAAPNHQELLAQYPLHEAELTLLSRCGEQLAQVLRGECEPLQLLFPSGDLSTTTQLYQTSPLARWFNTLAQKAMSEALIWLPDDREVRILEIGAGTGGTTAYLLPHLSARQTLYVFSDLSTGFTTLAPKQFSAYPFIRYHRLDIEQAPQAQGFDLQSFDLIVAANVLHATEDLQRTVQHVQQLLAPGGLLILLEGTKKQRWVDLIFGLTTGWWKFTDHALRPAYPLLSASQWQELLLANGFTDVVAFVPSPEQTEQTVLVAEKSRRIPLLESQKQLWVLSKMDDVGAQVAYNSYLSLRLTGTLNLLALRRAVQQVVTRHQALRTVFDSNGEFQYCRSALNFDVPLIDCTESLCAATTPAQTNEILTTTFFESESRQPFDLVHGPLIRVQVLKLAEQHHLLVLTIHHIISDGISMAIIANEIGAFYSAQCRGTAYLPNTPLQLSDYLQWQTRQSVTSEMAAHRDYWLNIFSDTIPILQLPVDRSYPAIRTYQGGKQSRRLPAELYRNLKTFSRQQRCTPFMTLLAAYMTWLYRISGQDDLVVGIPVAGRNLDGSDSLVGYCTHLLPIRTQIDAQATFTVHLQTLRAIILSAYEHQDYPFANLIEQLKLHRDSNHPPLVSVIFNLDKPSTLPELLGLEVALYPQPVWYSAFDLSFNLIEFGEEIVLDCTYNTDVFLPATIERLVANFRVLLDGIADNPACSLYQLPLLTQAETQQLIEWNCTETNYPQDQTIVNLFEEQVAKMPDNIAVVLEAQQLTYAELNKKANRLAHYLRTLTAIDNSLMAICVERSLEMVIGLLGILKAGGAYVPLDPDYPLERLSYMLADSQAPLLLTQSHLQERLPVTDAQIVYLDEAEVFDQQPDDNPILVSGPEDLAYVIYTSGSTGKPKGVCIPQQAVIRLVCQTDYQKFQPDERIAQASNTSFDAATYEIWGALLNGAQLIHIPKSILLQPSSLRTHLESNDISSLFITTALFNQIAREEPDTFGSLNYVLFGGEQVDPQWVSRILTVNPPRNLLHVYGPTESTTYATWYPVTAIDADAYTVPIGKPLANTVVYVLDTNHQSQPVGIPGELCIAGAGLARGYLNRPELTAEKFIEVELFGETQRIYKTGDLARWLPDGNLEYLGRLDYQIKLRGFRIELGEIEAVLTQHPAVKEAVVILSEREGNQSLAAYLTVHDEELLLAELRAWLQDQLPDYMVPAHWRVLDQLPLTPNGKIDRQALPAPDIAASGADYAAPRNPTEQQLAEIWSTVLKRPDISVHDNFFDLGGDSILSIQIVARARQADLGLSPRDVFAHQTLVLKTRNESDYLESQT